MIRDLSQASLDGRAEKARQNILNFANYYRDAKGRLPGRIVVSPKSYDEILRALNRDIPEGAAKWQGLCWKGVPVTRGAQS